MNRTLRAAMVIVGPVELDNAIVTLNAYPLSKRILCSFFAISLEIIEMIPLFNGNGYYCNLGRYSIVNYWHRLGRHKQVLRY